MSGGRLARGATVRPHRTGSARDVGDPASTSLPPPATHRSRHQGHRSPPVHDRSPTRRPATPVSRIQSLSAHDRGGARPS